MPNFGLLSAAAGAAQGVSSGVDAFFNMRSRLNEEAIKKQLANAQSLDAYSKLVSSGIYPEDAEKVAQRFGLIQGGGMLPSPEPANQGASNPNVGFANAPSGSADPTSNAKAGMAGAPLAPSGQAYRSETPNQGMLPDRATFKAAGAPYQAYQAAVKQSLDPKYQQDLQKGALDLKNSQYNYNMAPIEKTNTYLGDQKTAAMDASTNYVTVARALKQGGEGTPGVVFPALSKLANPRGKMTPDMIDSAMEQAGISGDAKTEVANFWSGLKKGDLSDRGKVAIRRIADMLIRNQLDGFYANQGSAEKTFGAQSGSTNIPSLQMAEKWYRTPLGIGEVSPTGSAGMGLLGGRPAMAAPSPQEQLDTALKVKASRSPRTQ